MLVTLIIDATDHRDRAIRDAINGWLHYATRNLWTASETKTNDDDDTVTLLFDFHDLFDASDPRYRSGLQGRGRLI